MPFVKAVIAHNDRGLEFIVLPDTHEWFLDYCPDSRALAELVGRRLVVMPNSVGFKLGASSDRNGEAILVCKSLNSASCLPRFMRHEVSMALGERGHLSYTLPPDHLLPWPKLRSECGAYHTPEVIIEELLLRFRSELRAGRRPCVADMPERLLSLIDGPRTWGAVLKRARALEDLN